MAKEDDPFPFNRVVNPITRAAVHSQLPNAGAHMLGVTEVAICNTNEPNSDLYTGTTVLQRLKPPSKKIVSGRVDVVP
jgi:hypothetical protein